MLHGKNWSFIHIPKCGGMALRRYLDGYEFGEFMPLGPECAVRSPLHRIPRKRPTGRVFTVIRHPAAWLRSYWLDQSPQRIGVHRYLHQFWETDLDEFVMNVCTGHPGYVTGLYRAYLRYRGVKVFRLEDGLDQVLTWLRVEPNQVSRVNGSSGTPRLGKQATALVAQTERYALRRFGYAS